MCAVSESQVCSWLPSRGCRWASLAVSQKPQPGWLAGAAIRSRSCLPMQSISLHSRYIFISSVCRVFRAGLPGASVWIPGCQKVCWHKQAARQTTGVPPPLRSNFSRHGNLRAGLRLMPGHPAWFEVLHVWSRPCYANGSRSIILSRARKLGNAQQGVSRFPVINSSSFWHIIMQDSDVPWILWVAIIVGSVAAFGDFSRKKVDVETRQPPAACLQIRQHPASN